MRKTIKVLEHELEHMKKSRDDYYDRYQAAEAGKRKADEELKMERTRHFDLLEKENRIASETVKILTEVIRWQINPETARAPFMPLFKENEVKIDPRRGMMP